MKVHLPYGETTIEAELPENTRLLSNVEQNRLPALPDLDGAVRAALAAPRGLPRIGALVRPGATVTIAFDDHTTGSFGPIREVAIRAVLDELDAAGVRRGSVTLICANALHRMLRPGSRPRSSSWKLTGARERRQAPLLDVGGADAPGFRPRRPALSALRRANAADGHDR